MTLSNSNRLQVAATDRGQRLVESSADVSPAGLLALAQPAVPIEVLGEPGHPRRAALARVLVLILAAEEYDGWPAPG